MLPLPLLSIPLIGGLLTYLAPKTLEIVRETISDEIIARAMNEAREHAAEMKAELHSAVVITIIWQNALLFASVGVAYGFGSAVPFYIAYSVVGVYSLVEMYKHRKHILSFIEKRSLIAVVKEEVSEKILKRLDQCSFVERKVVEYLGPDLQNLSDAVSRRIYPDIKVTLLNIVMTLLVSFVVFRVLVMPALSDGLGLPSLF